MHGGVKFYGGTAANARNYVEADRSCADDYYLAEGAGYARRFIVRADGVHECEPMDPATYEKWVAGIDVESGAPKGRLRKDGAGVRFVEFTVNGPKSWSLAAAEHPAIAAAYDAAQARAAREVVAWLGRHSTTRVGPRGRQVQVPVEEIEVAMVRHFTSRAGDPHRHVHVQINARAFAQCRFRGLHTVGVRDSIEAINGIGHAAVMADPQFRAVLAAHGYHLNLDDGEIVELEPYVRRFSARRQQIEGNIARYEAEWRRNHPGEHPGPVLRQAWDRRAWAEARPDKVVPQSGADVVRRWREELDEAGFRAPSRPVRLKRVRPGRLDREALVVEALTRLGAKRSAWNAADVRGEVERLIAWAGVVADGAVRTELAEDLTARTLARSVPLLGREDVPEHVRALTSPRVLAVEHHLVSRFAGRAADEARPASDPVVGGHARGLDRDQAAAVGALAGQGSLVVVEGAAGAGKTATLAATASALRERGRRLMVVSPTLKAAKVAAGQVGSASYSVAWLLYQHGFRWDEHGHWGRVRTPVGDDARLRRGDLLLVDEAGMLDQDGAVALMQVADETGVRLALVGDRHQLPAVGRGGVLDLAARYAGRGCVDLTGVRRFTDPAYAALSVRMRTGEKPDEVFDQLLARGEIVLHASEVEQAAALADAAKEAVVVADTREQVARINGLVHRDRVREGAVSEAFITANGERIGVGDQVATRLNDAEADVANREIWTVTGIGRDGVTVTGEPGTRVLPPDYAHKHVELAYASTVYGVQGATVPSVHVLVGDHTSAASAYVAMTRGRERNVAHLVADTVEEARKQWVEVFSRDRADLGPAHAAQRAAEDIERYGSRGTRRYVRRVPPASSPRRPCSAPRQPVPVAEPARRSVREGPGLGL